MLASRQDSYTFASAPRSQLHSYSSLEVVPFCARSDNFWHFQNLLATESCHDDTIRPGTHIAIEDVIAVDISIGRPYRKANNNRDGADPISRHMLHLLDLSKAILALAVGDGSRPWG